MRDRDYNIVFDWKTRIKQNLHGPDYYRRHLDLYGLNPDIFSMRKVMEVGCGPVGGVLPLITSAQERTGIDVLADEYKKAGLLRADNGVEIIRGDMTCLDKSVEAGSYDAIFCINTIDHGEANDAPQKAMEQFYKALSEDSVLFLHFHTREKAKIDLKHRYVINEVSMVNLADEVGFYLNNCAMYPDDPLKFSASRKYRTATMVFSK